MRRLEMGQAADLAGAQPAESAGEGDEQTLWKRLRDLGRRYWKWLFTELALAVPPTLTVLAAFVATGFLTSHPILFASLASSAFLIYRDPEHRMNRVRVMLAAQLLGWGIGSGAALLLGSNYLAGGVAMTLTIGLLVALDVVHPPAVSTALGFALIGPHYRLFETFLIALFMVALLAVLQRLAVWLVRRLGGEPEKPRPRLRPRGAGGDGTASTD